MWYHSDDVSRVPRRLPGRWKAWALALLLAGGLPSVAGAIETTALLDSLQVTAFQFFWTEANSANGLIKDRSTTWSPCSIASLGFGLSAICIGIDHGWVSREAGRGRILHALETLWTGPQGPGTSGTIGYQGFFYHFLDMSTATRTWSCELSSIDTALLLAGVIDTRQYFTGGDSLDVRVRALADSIYQRVDWEWMRNSGVGIRMGWKPETGFAGFGTWVGYNEAMILYLLALGSPTHPVPSSCWSTWTSGYDWDTQYGYSYVIFPPLFGHQYSHCWIDFRSTQDAVMRSLGLTYFENSRRATLAAREYCIANPLGWVGYGSNVWGITACDGPGGYAARGAPPPQNDDGTIAPTAATGSIAFAPEVVIPTLHHLYDTYRAQLWSTYGFKDAFNLTQGWWDTDYIGIDEGPIIIMIENYRAQAVWRRFMQNADVQRGLERAGFTWVTSVAAAPGESPLTTALHGGCPNPFRAGTTLGYELATGGDVRLEIYDVKGRRVAALVQGVQGPGNYRVEVDAGQWPSGVYYCRLLRNGRAEGKAWPLVRMR